MAVKKPKVSARDSRLKRLYGLEPGEYEKILAFQDGLCYICGKPPKEGKNLHVDHDHKTGQTRGLLDWQCNSAIGKFKDDKQRLQKAAEYISNPPASLALGRDVFGRIGRITNKRKKTRKSSKRK